MLRDILLKNDEVDDTQKSFWVYRQIETTLAGLAREDQRSIDPRFALDERWRDRRGTVYTSVRNIIALGLEAHAHLSNVSKKSVLYLDADDGTDRTDSSRLTSNSGRAEAASTLITLGTRAGAAARLLCASPPNHHKLPPLDLTHVGEADGCTSRITVINHLQDGTLGRSIVAGFVNRSDFMIDCYGLEPQHEHNRVRYLPDAEVSGGGGSAHVHVGRHDDKDDRLRISDSWQSNVPVLLVDAPCTSNKTDCSLDIRDGGNALFCHTYEDVSGYLNLLRECSALKRLLLANGRNTAAQSFDAWRAIGRDLVS